ncbi:MAG: response regulator [Deltaproteobacteria bacterium]|jgi:DNA-binding response OmpR family regulator|nr:response regulator [Deltaproteobacteria bacterium]
MEILIVDDDPMLGKMLKQSIEKLGYRAENAYTGKEAIKKLEEGSFDGILLDIFLPDCQGHTLIPRFRALNPHIHIITMTGFNTRDLELEVRKQGIDQYFSKPLDLKVVKMSLDHLANRLESMGDKQNRMN